MKKSMELRDPRSCLGRARADEPIFVLLARDQHAPGTIREWCDRYLGANGGFSGASKRQRAKVLEALALADEMERWYSDDVAGLAEGTE